MEKLVINLPATDEELLACGEWVKGLVLSAGGQPETAFAVALEFMKGLRREMDRRGVKCPSAADVTTFPSESKSGEGGLDG